MKWNFFVTTIIKRFPGNFSDLARSLPQQNILSDLSEPWMILSFCLPFSYDAPGILIIWQIFLHKKEEAKEGKRGMSEPTIPFRIFSESYLCS